MNEVNIIDWVNEILSERGYTKQDFYLLDEEKEQFKELLKSLSNKGDE